MRFTPGFLLLVLLVSSLSPVQGVLETFNTNLKCRCRRTTSGMIPINNIERIQTLFPGNGCPRKEIIVWTKNKKGVCLNTQVKWINRLITIMQKRGASPTPQISVFKKKIA
ncbi:C-X-C motif chemokine 13 [Talpa occidentalis]|uniref:C-X-C motif chemokine 13 n=1 Tax=Talpa occidentalis TaxID=50954 RepID=UPI00188F46A7|nr:C-X-C motif chemokine 13 [Talpa occidentalis]